MSTRQTSDVELRFAARYLNLVLCHECASERSTIPGGKPVRWLTYQETCMDHADEGGFHSCDDCQEPLHHWVSGDTMADLAGYRGPRDGAICRMLLSDDTRDEHDPTL